MSQVSKLLLLLGMLLAASYSKEPIATHELRAATHKPLIEAVARRCLHKTNIDVIEVISNLLQFWQTWGNMEFATLLERSPYIGQAEKADAKQKATALWTNFVADSNLVAPSYFQPYPAVVDNRFWDPKNTYILWDDRQWLGLSYLELFRQFSGHSLAGKYLAVAEHLHDLIVKGNADPESPDYEGIEWKAGSGFRNSVTNELFMVLGARLFSLKKDAKYLLTLKAQYQLLFRREGKYINHAPENIFPDSSDGGEFYTYNQGMAMEGLAYLAVFDPHNAQEYAGQLSRLINGWVRHFRDKKSGRYILREVAGESFGASNKGGGGGSTFKGLLLRHLLRAKMLLASESPSVWSRVVEQTPILKIALLDTFQALLKFENLELPDRWEEPNGTVHFYNQFNHFYGLYCGHEIFGLQQIVTEGIELSCQSVLQLELGTRVKSAKLTTLVADIDAGRYVNYRQYALSSGLTSLKSLIGEDLCLPSNNRNFLNLDVGYADGSSAVYTIAHLPMANAKFSLIPDRTAEELANGFGVRIFSKVQNITITYRSEQANSQVSLESRDTDGSAAAYIRMRIE